MADATPRAPRPPWPPGVGWLPYLLAIAAVILAGVFGIVPQFQNKVVGTYQTGGGTASAGPGSAAGGGTNGGTAGTSGTSGSSGSSGTTGGGGSSLNCARGQNGGATAPGVTATQIKVSSTDVTTGVGAGFLGQAGDGVQAAIQEFNNAGGACGRKITDLNGSPGITLLNDDWQPAQGNSDISGWVNSSNPPFALVGEPDSEGLDAASTSGTIDSAGIPVVGSDGMLKSQYHDPWIFPVAASTVTNMHIIADQFASSASSFGIIFDNHYKFGVEGADAFAQELMRHGKSVAGYSHGSTGCTQAYCGIDTSGQGGYSTQEQTFNSACAPCDVVVLLLEPGPAETWVQDETNGNAHWYGKALEGGEPLFDNNLGSNCGSGCGNAPLHAWTGYCVYQSTDPSSCNGSAVNAFCSALHSVPGAGSDDCQNEFTEGAYLGAKLFCEALKRLAQANLPLTRANLQKELTTGTYDLGLSPPLTFGGGSHIANFSMGSYHENYSGSFNGWTYDSTGFEQDGHKSSDL